MKVGTCGVPVAWDKYVKNFSVVEIQKTFYTPLNERIAKRWRNRVLENFEFTLKAPQTITHEMKSPTYRRYRGPPGNFGRFRVNEDTMHSWERFVKIARIMRARIIIFQSPPSFSESEENVKNIKEFFSTVEGEFIYGWEPRGRWKDETVQSICEELNLVHVVDPFKGPSLHGEFSYYRLHGMGNYRHRYSTEELNYLRNITGEKDYVLFNNTNMWEDALRFKEILKSKQ